MMYYYYSQDATLIADKFKYSVGGSAHWTSTISYSSDYHYYYYNKSSVDISAKSNYHKFLCVRTAN